MSLDQRSIFEAAPFPEPSAGLIFSGASLARHRNRREADCLERAMENPDTRFIVFAHGRVIVRFASPVSPSPANDAPACNPVFERHQIADFMPVAEHAVLLGHEGDTPLIAMPSRFEPEQNKLPDNIKAIDYRSLAIQGLLPPTLLGAVAQGAALLAWHSSHRFCSRCGQPSVAAEGGYKRICPSCKRQHFPRTDPVVIMLAIDGENCLMGRSHNWAEGMYSALAGFVEPGETFEDAVRREIAEEAGITIGKVKYQANQPWPFPHTLMIGCFAEATNSKITIDTEELSDCRWFSRSEIIEATDNPEGASFFVPPKMAIARHLIDTWARWPNG